jgi:hypothetical protein
MVHDRGAHGGKARREGETQSMTITAISNAKNYAWKDWLIGGMRSFLSGGAAAFLTLGGGALVGVPGKQVWQMMGINFIAMGLYRMGEFLQLHGSPEPVGADSQNAKPQ